MKPMFRIKVFGLLYQKTFLEFLKKRSLFGTSSSFSLLYEMGDINSDLVKNSFTAYKYLQQA